MASTASTHSKQRYTSAKTCVNQVPAAFKKIPWYKGERNLDYGGGKYNTATLYLSKLGVNSYVYDPFNRSKSHNKFVLDQFKRQPANTATLCNVLNVVKEKSVRKDILLHVKELLEPMFGTVYISCYRGRGTKGRKTCNGWQNNKPLSFYLPEVKAVFPNAEIANGIIYAF